MELELDDSLGMICDGSGVKFSESDKIEQAERAESGLSMSKSESSQVFCSIVLLKTVVGVEDFAKEDGTKVGMLAFEEVALNTLLDCVTGGISDCPTGARNGGTGYGCCCCIGYCGCMGYCGCVV
jgi:hypothetical protein